MSSALTVRRRNTPPATSISRSFQHCLWIPSKFFQIANHLSGSLGFEVDLVDLNRASTVFRKEVICTGAPIHIGDPSLRHRFEMYALSDYARLNEERRKIITQ